MLNRRTFFSWEFVALILSNAAVWLASTGATVSHANAVYFTAASAGVYALARGLAKVNHDAKDWWQTSEFYIAIIGAATAVIGNLNGTLGDSRTKQVLAFLTFLSMVARGIAKVPAVQAGLAPPTRN